MEAFTGADAGRQLDEEARKFIRDTGKVRFDRDRRTLYLSSIFKWFGEDFGDVKLFVARYLPEDQARSLRQERIRIRYLRYDWSLNEQK